MPLLLRRIFYGALLLQMLNIAGYSEVLVPAAAASSQSVEVDRTAGEMRRSEPGQGRRGVLRPVSEVQCPPAADWAEPLDPPTTSALIGEPQFSARQHFRADDSPRSEVRISWLGASFIQRFAVKIEPRSAPAAALRIFVLTRSSRSIGIAEEFDQPYETRLADLWCLLKLQPNGEAGVLLTNAQPNLFFVRNATGRLGVVDVLWSGAGWEIGASPMTNNRPWPASLRVIAR